MIHIRHFVISVCLVAGPMFAAPIDCPVQREIFPILGEGDRCVLAGELKVGIYAADTLMSKLRADWKSQSEDERLKTPEYLIVRQFDQILSGDKTAVLSDYYGPIDKAYAQKIFSDMTAAQAFRRDDVKDLKFVTKTCFGGLVRIRFKHLLGKGFDPSWASYLRLVDGRYYFVEMPGNDLFNRLSEAFPYWKPKKERTLTPSADMLIAHFQPKDVEDKTSALTLYYNVDRAAPDTMVLLAGDNRSEELAFIKQMIQAYRNGDLDTIVGLWDSGRQQVMRARFTNEPESLEVTRSFFQKPADFRMEFSMRHANERYLYISPKMADGSYGPLRLIRTTVENGKIVLTDRMPSVLANMILGSEEMNMILNAQLQQAK